MVMSTLRTELDCDLALKDTPLPLPKDNIRSTSLPWVGLQFTACKVSFIQASLQDPIYHYEKCDVCIICIFRILLNIPHEIVTITVLDLNFQGITLHDSYSSVNVGLGIKLMFWYILCFSCSGHFSLHLGGYFMSSWTLTSARHSAHSVPPHLTYQNAQQTMSTELWSCCWAGKTVRMPLR